MRQFLKYVGKSLSFVIPAIVFKSLFGIYRMIYTGFKSRNMKSFGVNSILCPPLELIGERYLSIGINSSIGKRTSISAWNKHNDNLFLPEIVIGNNVAIGEDCHITASNKIVIGNNVLFGKKITVTDNSHGNSDFKSLQIPPLQRDVLSKGPVIIEDRVWIGDKVTILPNVTIGEGSIVGANSVVTKNVPAYSVVAGNPARIIKTLFQSRSTGALDPIEHKGL